MAQDVTKSEQVFIGRPLSLTPEIADKLVQGAYAGWSIKRTCEEHGINRPMAMRWIYDERLQEHPVLMAFRDNWTNAVRIKAHCLIDETLDIADDGRNDWLDWRSAKGDVYLRHNTENIQRSRLRIDQRKWLAGRILPDVYGDKQQIDVGIQLAVLVQGAQQMIEQGQVTIEGKASPIAPGGHDESPPNALIISDL